MNQKNFVLLVAVQPFMTHYIKMIYVRILSIKFDENDFQFSIFFNLKVLFSAKLWNLSYSPFIEGNPELNLALLIGGIYE